MRPNRAMIRDLDISAILVGAIVVHNSEVEVLIVEILHIHSISLRFSPVDRFRQLFRLPTEVSLVLVISLVRIVNIL